MSTRLLVSIVLAITAAARAAASEVTSTPTCVQLMQQWLPLQDNATLSVARDACMGHSACAAYVLGSQTDHHLAHVSMALRSAEFGDLAAAICGDNEQTAAARLLAHWLAASMLMRRDLCPRGMEHVSMPDAADSGSVQGLLRCDCLSGNPCEQYYSHASDSDNSTVETILWWVTAVSGVVLLLLGIVRFLVVYDRTVPNHKHTQHSTK